MTDTFRMTSKRTLAIIALVALLVGIVFTSIGIYIGIWFITQSPQSTSSPVSDVPVGFVFGNSENLTQEATYFRLHLENVDCNEETIKAELYMIVVSQEMENPTPLYNDNSIFFLLQIPSEITDVKVDYHMRDRDPQFYGGDYELINSTVLHSGLSAILVEIPKENFEFGENEFLAFYFTMSNVFSNVNSYTYQRALTFSSSFDDAVSNLNLLRDVEYRNTAVFRFLHTAELFVEEPYEVNSQIMPLPQGIHYYSNHTHYSWNIKTIATSVGSDSVILEFEDIPIKNELLFLDNVMWLSLGLGIPLFISSLFEFLRVKDGLSQIRGFTSLKSELHRNSLNMEGTKDIDNNTIGELIRLVDSNKFDLFKYYDIFRGRWGITLASLTSIVIIIFIVVLVDGIILKMMPILDQIVLVLSQLSLFFAFFALTTRIGEKHVIDIRFKRALDLKQSFTEDEKPILKALIKLRSRNPETDLERIYNMHPEMFTKEKLLEKLYADKLYG